MIREVKAGGRHTEDYDDCEDERTSLPTETFGECKKCHQYDVLGDGYCIGCWDKVVLSLKNSDKSEWKKKRKYQTIQK
jgi:hypothetical protein